MSSELFLSFTGAHISQRRKTHTYFPARLRRASGRSLTAPRHVARGTVARDLPSAGPISAFKGGDAKPEGMEQLSKTRILAMFAAVAPVPPTARSEGLARFGRCGGRRRTGKDGAEPRLPPSLTPSLASPPPPSLPSLPQPRPRPRLRPRPFHCSVLC